MGVILDILTVNYIGELANITLYPCTGGSIDLGTVLLPYSYEDDNYFGTYEIYVINYDQTCFLEVPCPSNTPTPTPTMTVTPTNTLTPTPTPTPTMTVTPTNTLTPTPTPTPTTLLTGGSLDFVPSDPDFLKITGDTSFAAVGTGDFTVEWFQYQKNVSTENYLFCYAPIGMSGARFSVSTSIGANNLNCRMGGPVITNPTISLSINTWYHVAITRVSGVFNAYFNGIRVVTLPNTTDIFYVASTFFIGSRDGTGSNNDNFPGNITNFRFVKGTAVYTGGTLTIPTSPLLPIAGTELLLSVTTSPTYIDDSSGTGKVVINNGAVFSTLTPF